MKVLWWMNSSTGHASELLGYQDLQSGKWIEACFRLVRDYNKDLKIDYAIVGNKKLIMSDKKNDSLIFEVPVARDRGRRFKNAVALAAWRDVIERSNPDIILVWGTEYTAPLDLMDCAQNTPVVVFLQGIVFMMAKYLYGNLRFSEMVDISDLKKIKSIVRMVIEGKKLKAQVSYEREIILRSKGIIADSSWAFSACDPYSEIAHYYIPLPIDNVFMSFQWDATCLNAHRILTIAGNSPMKGLHDVLYAVKILITKYPKIMVVIPGSVDNGSVYWRFLQRFIRQNNLVGHVEFVGKLDANDMAKQMSQCSAFVMPSCIENHSSTLREAMVVGCPCVSTNVGSIHELLYDGENALTYRYGEPEILAGAVDRLFGDEALAKQIGSQAKMRVIKMYPQGQIGKAMNDMFMEVVARGNITHVTN